MLPIYYGEPNLYTPPSSPPSPSSLYQGSSSPPSSPSHDPRALDSDYELDVDHATSSSPRSLNAPIDPLAGAYRSTRVKRRSNAFTPVHTPKKKARYRSRSPQSHPASEAEEDAFDAFMLPQEKEKHRQKLLWDAAIEKVFQSGEREIDLSNQNLSEVPPQAVTDLGKIVVLPENNEPLDDIRAGFTSPKPGPASGRSGFSRTHTAPASTVTGWGRVGPNGKTMSSNSILGMSREAMNIFLGKNNISKLPMELWSLHNLTVLSLRNNSITYIPGEIAELKELQTLNIANNKLRFIPSEMLSMKKLTRLNLFPNPFLPEPPRNREGKRVSETEVKGPRVPALTELALRILLSHSSSTGASETVLQQYYELPLVTSDDQRPITAFRQIFNICIPGSVLPEDGPHKRNWKPENDTTVTGAGQCPNPRHHERSTFIQPMEERYTWESSTISIKSLGGTAAVQWRGCLQGCLDFLGPEPEDEKPRENMELPGDDSMDIDLEESEVVQTVRFEMDAELGFDY